MKRSGVLRDLGRQVMLQLNKILKTCAIALAMVWGAFAPALAGDRALADVIGFSEDGRYFAFEEFGIQDGSGFAYSTVYMIDLIADRWVIGTPVHAEAEDEDMTLIEIRRLAQTQALPRLDDLRIHRPAEDLVLLGEGDLAANGHAVAFGLPSFSGLEPPVGRYDLTLERFDAKATAPCGDWFDDEPQGFALDMQIDGVETRVYGDGILPRSRGCPMDYRIKGVFIPSQTRDLSRAVALISVYAHGFEGPDRRFLAVPIDPERGQ